MENKSAPNAGIPVPGLQVVAYLLAIALPTTVAAVLLPRYAGEIVAGGVLLFLTLSAFIAGWQWDDPAWIPAIRQFRRVPIVILLFLVTLFAMHATQEHDLWRSAVASGLAISVVLGPMLLGFFAGRWIHRRAAKG